VDHQSAHPFLAQLLQQHFPPSSINNNNNNNNNSNSNSNGLSYKISIEKTAYSGSDTEKTSTGNNIKGNKEGDGKWDRKLLESLTSSNNSSTTVSVDILMIDNTEGHDGLVLMGAKHLFKQRAIRCVIFEYHSVLPWGEMRLEDTVKELDSLGYDCFFQGQNRLWRITGSCWHSNYEFHLWSNVMCIERNDVWLATIQPFIMKIEPLCKEILRFEGKVLRGSDSKAVYLVEKGEIKLFMSGKAFVNRGYDFDNVIVVDPLLLRECFATGQSLY
jgi:hypothetical protein